MTVRLRSEPGMGVLEVADRGPGLRPDQAERVFERFYRVDSARTRPPAGGPGGVRWAAPGWGWRSWPLWSRRIKGRSRSRVDLARALRSG